jgi:hypothetical protein
MDFIVAELVCWLLGLSAWMIEVNDLMPYTHDVTA